MNTENEENLEAVLLNIEEKLQALEDHRSEIHKKITLKRAQIKNLTEAIELLHEMEAD